MARVSEASSVTGRRAGTARALVAQHRPTLVAGALAAALAAAYLVAPLTGQDLAAQIARADFAREHPFTPVDLRWFGGSLSFGYSLWTPLVMAWAGVRLTGALCCVVATMQTTLLFERTAAKRPTVGGVLIALTQTINLVAGRVTFSLGMVCGLGALLAITSERARRTTPLQRAGVLAFLAGAASPVAALYLWVCGGALVLSHRWRAGVTVLLASAGPVIVIGGLFPDGGNEPFSSRDFRDALLATLVVLVVLPLRRPLLQRGALLAVIMVVLAYVLDTPVGNNVTRLSMLFAVPVVGAYVTCRPALAALAVVAAGYPQQVSVHYSFTFGPSASEAYYAPLIAQVRARGPVVGRVEIPETSAHWDDAFVARSLPLARGWIRQVDVALNEDVFFDDPPTATQYRTWLDANSVQYVAVPDATLTGAGENEVQTIARHPSYLQPIWRNDHWTLYSVATPTPIVAAPGRLVATDWDSVTVYAPDNATVRVNLRWFRWLSLAGNDSGGCIARSSDGRLRLSAERAGDYEITSALLPAGHCAEPTG